MADKEAQLGDWRAELGRTRFFSKRDKTGGTQFEVFDHKLLGYVIKVPKNSVFLDGYRLVQEKAAKQSVPSIIAENISLSVDGFKVQLDYAVVQLRTKILIDRMEELRGIGDYEAILRLAKSFAQTDREIFNKGIFTSDPNITNYGLDGLEDVKLCDAGGAREVFDDDLEYTGLVHNRTRSHQTNLLYLRFIQQEMPGNTSPLDKAYREALGFPDITHPLAQNLDDFEEFQYDQVHPELASLCMSIGHAEFEQFAPNGAPNKIDVSGYLNFLKGMRKGI